MTPTAPRLRSASSSSSRRCCTRTTYRRSCCTTCTRPWRVLLNFSIRPRSASSKATSTATPSSKFKSGSGTESNSSRKYRPQKSNSAPTSRNCSIWSRRRVISGCRCTGSRNGWRTRPGTSTSGSSSSNNNPSRSPLGWPMKCTTPCWRSAKPSSWTSRRSTSWSGSPPSLKPSNRNRLTAAIRISGSPGNHMLSIYWSWRLRRLPLWHWASSSSTSSAVLVGWRKTKIEIGLRISGWFRSTNSSSPLGPS